MSEQLYFFKIQKEKVEDRLYERACAGGHLSFADFIFEYSVGSDLSVNFPEITRKIKDDMGTLSQEQFWGIFEWFRYRAESLYPGMNDRDRETQYFGEMSDCGIDFFHEIPSKMPVRKFHSILSDYECSIDADMNFFCTSAAFNDFLNYGICFTGELLLFLDEHYYSEKHYQDCRYQIEEINRKYGRKSHELALKGFDEAFLYYRMAGINQLSALEMLGEKATSAEPAASRAFSETVARQFDLIDLANNYTHLMELKKHTEALSGNIVRLHSV